MDLLGERAARGGLLQIADDPPLPLGDTHGQLVGPTASPHHRLLLGVLDGRSHAPGRAALPPVPPEAPGEGRPVALKTRTRTTEGRARARYAVAHPANSTAAAAVRPSAAVTGSTSRATSWPRSSSKAGSWWSRRSTWATIRARTRPWISSSAMLRSRRAHSPLSLR